MWGSSDEKKREFLVQKGLTTDEIEEAFKRVHMSMVRPQPPCFHPLLSSSRPLLYSLAGYLSSPHTRRALHETMSAAVFAVY